MGVCSTVNYYDFPKQGNLVGLHVKVCFNYDTSKTLEGICVREDTGHPFVTIFKLEDGRYVLATECMYSFR